MGEKYGGMATPTGVVVTPEGRIGSRVAAGAEEIRELLIKLVGLNGYRSQLSMVSGQLSFQQRLISTKVNQIFVTHLAENELTTTTDNGRRTMIGRPEANEAAPITPSISTASPARTSLPYWKPS